MQKKKRKRKEDVVIYLKSTWKSRIMIVKMTQDLRKRMKAQIEQMQEMFNKDLEELKASLVVQW